MVPRQKPRQENGVKDWSIKYLCVVTTKHLEPKLGFWCFFHSKIAIKHNLGWIFFTQYGTIYSINKREWF